MRAVTLMLFNVHVYRSGYGLTYKFMVGAATTADAKKTAETFLLDAHGGDKTAAAVYDVRVKAKQGEPSDVVVLAA